MANVLQSLFTAILKSDIPRARSLIDRDPVLFRRGLDDDWHFEPIISHWIYAGDTAMHVAAAAHQLEIAPLLLALGADIVSARNRRGAEPLHYASDGASQDVGSAKRQVSMIRLLLKAGAAIDTQDKNGATPLHRAVRTRCPAAVQTLLAAGADPTIQNKPGSTPFHLAVQNTGKSGSGSAQAKTAQHQIIRAFLAHGISPTGLDAKGKSVRQWVNSPRIVKILDEVDA